MREPAKHTELTFQLIVESAPNALILVNKEGKIAFANSQAERLFGFSRHELTGNPIEMLMPSRLSSGHIDFRNAFFISPKARPMGVGRDLFALKKDGTEFPVEIGLNPIVTVEGTMVLAAVIDITERKNFEEKQALFVSIVSTSDDAIISKTLDGIITSWNRAAEKIFGYTMEEMIGKHISVLIPPHLQNEETEIIEKIRKGEMVDHFETERVRKDGKSIPVSLTISPVKDKFGKITGASNISQDITERKEAEAKIERASRLYAFLSAINQSIVHIKDEKQLLDNVCNIAIQIGKFKMAWIGLLDEDCKINLVSSGGSKAGIEMIERYSGFDYDDPALRNTITGKVLLAGKYQINNDLQNDPDYAQWKDYFVQQGIYAGVSLPIFRSEKAIGFFGLQAGVKDFFDADEIKLLEEAAGDISFALDNFDKEKQRSLAEEKVLLNEGRLKQAQSIAHVGSWEMDLETKKSLWSEELCRIFGIAPSDNQQSTQSFLSFVHPEDIDFVTNAIENSNATHSDCSLSHRIITRQGDIRYLLTERRFEFDAKGKPQFLHGVCHDVTESKKAALAIEESEKKYRHLFYDNPMPIWILDRTTFKFLDVNNAALQQYGYTKEEFLSITALDLRPDTEKERFINLDRSNKAETENTGIWIHLKKDGTPIYVEISSAAIVYEGKPARLVLANDVTARIKTEMELHTAAEIQSSILDALPANIALLDKDGVIVAVNESWKKFGLGNNLCSKNHCIGDNYLTIAESATGFEAAEGRKMAEGIRGVISGQIPDFEMEYTCHSPGEQRWFKAEVAPLMKKGRTGAVVMHINITREKIAENKIHELNENLEERVQERTADLTEANKALEAFSSTVSHDLRAPVRAVTSFARIIRDDYGDKMDAQQKELFGYIEDNGKRMNEIIDDLLKLARYGHEKLKLEVVDMTELVNGVWLNISRTTPHHAVLELAQLPGVKVDMGMMQQVLVNLLGNAIKYSSKVPAPVVKIWCERSDKGNTFYFKDNGAGFDMENYGKLFGAFQRLHSNRDFDGTGVGLALVKRIIEKHRGTVGAIGKVGEGATFYFTLPL